MEESENRRERLKAMRMQAAQAEVSNNAESSGVPGCLSNPLIETSVVQESCTPRFDFYTDPMSAFSDSRKRSNAASQIRPDYFKSPSSGGSLMSRFSPSHPAGPRNPVMTPPVHHIQSSWSSNQTMYEAQGSSYSSGPHRSPIGTASPFPMHPRTPEVWNGPMGPTSYSFSSNPSRGGHPPSPAFGPRGGSQYLNTGQGRGQWVSQSPSPGSGPGLSPSPRPGRGGGRWYDSSMSPGSGRGRGYYTPQGPERFYNASMLEDPWKFLEPVLWKCVVSSNTPYSSKSWTGKSQSTKKARVSEASNKSSSQPSLAEYLAASFNEALNDAANT
ncbi:protein SICKLE isoform X3 [Alnus glutinosa]|uniref:protein SICKLE isoform X3 n=1 Tax=Alnus glutinosa TaxID=3517 RepID=UPI002D784209|nr:protein SICKLE isoform X3 [Alnus glutinosa]